MTSFSRITPEASVYDERLVFVCYTSLDRDAVLTHFRAVDAACLPYVVRSAGRSVGQQRAGLLWNAVLPECEGMLLQVYRQPRTAPGRGMDNRFLVFRQVLSGGSNRLDCACLTRTGVDADSSSGAAGTGCAEWLRLRSAIRISLCAERASPAHRLTAHPVCRIQVIVSACDQRACFGHKGLSRNNVAYSANRSFTVTVQN